MTLSLSLSLCAVCCLGAATRCWRCSTPSPGNTPSSRCCPPACWTSAARPPPSSSACWRPACRSCWSCPLRRWVSPADLQPVGGAGGDSFFHLDQLFCTLLRHNGPFSIPLISYWTAVEQTFFSTISLMTFHFNEHTFILISI